MNRRDTGPGGERRRLGRASTSVQRAPRSASAILLVQALVDTLDFRETEHDIPATAS